MNLATLDNLAVNHHCWLQRCSALAKVVFIAAVLCFLLTTMSLPFIAGLAGLLLAVAVTNRLPLIVLLPFAFIPMIFAGIFALSIRDWTVGLTVIGRAGTAALTAAMVSMTTAPVKLLGLISAPMPEVFGELIYFTYRSLFLLGGSLDNTLKAVRLRRGKEKFCIARVRAMAQVYGMTLVRAWDMAGRQYDLLRLRGLGQGLKISRDWHLCSWDLGLLAVIILIGVGWYFV
ncbi:MAG: energy-coupling factor transporter transmembrane component T [Eubacteriales bacterium]|nr:energy-coupling factor transporter transmembrane component T [Eubacteriales bacterium]MDD3072903.1 energy-coupling factor transporter transmembrane component T [Eubacteriales bacterium]MDD4079365.1 energy-coupling factor transporter transmembrane component T [Eubacteriales bacterium]MDD4769290.1 energy-coupling factor transporter transmembrane component T [Eubacteriales bacterium]